MHSVICTGSGQCRPPRLPALPAKPHFPALVEKEVQKWASGCLPPFDFWEANTWGKNSSIQHNPLTKSCRVNTRLSRTKHPSSLDCCLAMTQNLHIKNRDLSNFFLYNLPSVKLNNDDENSKIYTQKSFVTTSVVTHGFKGLLLNCLYAWQLGQKEMRLGHFSV